MKKNRSDDGWLNIPVFTYSNKKSPLDTIEVFKDSQFPGAKIVQTNKNGCQSIVVNEEQLGKMLKAFISNGWSLKNG